MAANYDSIAPVYDLLSRIIYGRAIVNIQVSLLQYVPANSRILIAGGGTGWILEKLAALHSSGLAIDYVDASAKMIALSGNRKYSHNKVNFFQLPMENFDPVHPYEVIITPFFFDNFQKDKIEMLFAKMDSMLVKDGIWLYADFVYNRDKSPLWQKAMLKIMYLFFRITVRIEAAELVSMDEYFHIRYAKLTEFSRYLRFIRGTVWRRRG